MGSVVWPAPRATLCRWGRSGAVFIWAFSSCTRPVRCVCETRCASCTGHSANWRSASGNSEHTRGSRALLPFCYRKDFMQREENRKSKWWLKLFPDLCVLWRSSRSGWSEQRGCRRCLLGAGGGSQPSFGFRNWGFPPVPGLVLKVDVGSMEVWGPETLAPAEVTGSVV